MSCYKTIRISCMYKVEKVVGEQPKNSLCFFWENSKKKLEASSSFFQTNNIPMMIRWLCWRSSRTLNQLIFLLILSTSTTFVTYVCTLHYLTYLLCLVSFFFSKKTRKIRCRSRAQGTFSVHLHVYVCLSIYVFRTLVFLFYFWLHWVFSSQKEEERKQEDHLCFFLSCLYSLYAFSTRSHLSVLLLWMTWLERKKSSMVFGSKKIVKCVYVCIQLNIPDQKVLPP